MAINWNGLRNPQIRKWMQDTIGAIQAEPVTKARASIYVSTVLTGSGTAQEIAHGLGATPALVLVSAYGDGATVTEGTHTDTNLIVTVTDAKSYKVVAWA